MRLDGYGYHNKRQTQGKDFRVLAFTQTDSCESGRMVCVTHPLVGNVTLDAHWLIFQTRPVDDAADWDDDIPFRPASYSLHQGKRIQFSDAIKNSPF